MKNKSITDSKQKNGSIKLKIFSHSILADLETPVSAFIKLRSMGAKVLLESVENGTTLGRYTFIGLQLDTQISVDSEKTTINDGNETQSYIHTNKSSPLDTLRDILSNYSLDNINEYPPLLGGAVGYISYDFVRFFENISDNSKDDLNLPLAKFYIVNSLLVFDHLHRRITIYYLADESCVEKSNEIIDQIRAALLKPPIFPGSTAYGPSTADVVPNVSQDEFYQMVEKAKENIRNGDVYQQVVSRRLHGKTEVDPFTIYRALRILNPSPYMYFLDFDNLKIIGSSPEVLIRLDGNIATVRPIAGTRSRGANDEEDKLLGQELSSDKKELAEHVMLVDLGRNDLGRCCEIGSVRVTDYMKIDKYSHVMHLTSNIEGKLKSEMDQFDLFRAAFPAGTVSGAPKIRAMQLIDKIEHTRRGPYAGAVGYFSLTGNMDWCINIRSILMTGKDYYLQAGAGIVADSVPKNEYLETEKKIAALKCAIENAERGL